VRRDTPAPPLAGEKKTRSGHIVHWVAKHNNSRMDFLRKTRRFTSDSEIKEFLDKLLDVHKDSFDVDPNGFRIKPELVNARIDGFHSIEWYRCDRCGRITSFNFDSLCPQFRCDGRLYATDTESLDGYHRKKVQESSLFPMKVAEHTAQLGHEMARDYQHKFITGEINVLSSSTTFEMGVDVGELETVFMRNMPPSPANYVQRAGRAGRRTDSAAFALTFCRLANHDLAFFRDPSRMINGRILPPVFKLDNEKIVRRHIYATLLAAFWRQHDDLKTAAHIFGDEAWSDFSIFLGSLPEGILQYIYEFSPPTMSRETVDSIINDFVRENGALSDVRTKYMAEVSGIDAMESAAAAEKKYKIAERLKYDRNRLQGEPIIELFSRNNLIPKYGFPIDTVELAADLTKLHGYNRGDSGLRLQRDLFQAITDYAPGSEVIADKQIYTSQYIRLPPYTKKEAWLQHEYGICPNEKCGMLNISPHYGDTNLKDKSGECKYCGSEYSVKGVFIVPEYGFIVSTKPPVKASTRAPSRGGRTDVFYIGDAFGKKELRTVFRFKGIVLTVTTSENDELAVINKSDFAVCQRCGYTEKNPKRLPVIKSTKSHNTPYGQECKNRTLIKKGLGHTFRTDVCMISVNQYLETDEAYSILYAFLEGMAEFFDIDRHDIDGTVSRRRIKSGEWDTVFVLFDKVPGGAGHSSRLGAIDATALEGFLAAGRNVVEKCTCGDRGDGNAACYSCLCNYSNQSLHDILKRKHAIDFYRSLGELVSVESESSGND
jgi:hypothetical protein